MAKEHKIHDVDTASEKFQATQGKCPKCKSDVGHDGTYIFNLGQIQFHVQCTNKDCNWFGTEIYTEQFVGYE